MYNAEETGLYWKLLPGKTYVSREEKTALGRKKAKERITLLECSNATELHKLTPLVIGKAKNHEVLRSLTLLYTTKTCIDDSH